MEPLAMTPRRAAGGGVYSADESSIICESAEIERGCEIGPGSFIGRGCVLRPGTKIGSRTVVGHLTVFEGDSVIGDDCLIHAQCHITAGVVIEDKVFIAPGFIGANDMRMSHARRDVIPFERRPYTIRRGARIAIGVHVLPGVEIGANSIVGAGSLVTRDVPERAIVMGRPARVVGETRDEEVV